MKPLIGIGLDYRLSGAYSSYPWYALRQNYCDAILAAGGVPILIPYALQHIECYLDRVAGVLIPGGVADVDPTFYKETIRHEKTLVDPVRGTFDHALLQGVLKRGLPFLGICAGMQMLNVALGGTLHQHLPDVFGHEINHNQTLPKHLPSHSIHIEPDTLLHSIAQTSVAMVNSTHHQGVKELGNGLIASAYSVDGVIEAIEKKEHRFCMGVEWHPEYQTTDLDQNIFKHFIKACYGTYC